MNKESSLLQLKELASQENLNPQPEVLNPKPKTLHFRASLGGGGGGRWPGWRPSTGLLSNWRRWSLRPGVSRKTNFGFRVIGFRV